MFEFPGRLFVNMASFPEKGYGLKEESHEMLLGEHLRSLAKACKAPVKIIYKTLTR